MKKKGSFSSLSGKKKVEYVWDYYRLHILFGLCGIAATLSLITNWISYREPILDMIMVNNGVVRTDEKQNEAVGTLAGFDEFLTTYGYEVYDNAVNVEASLYFTGDKDDYDTAQVLSVMLASGSRDMLFAPEDVFLTYARQGAAADLTNMLSEELLEKVAAQLVYAEKLDGSGSFPCGIRLSDNPWMKANGYYLFGECVVGVLSLSDNYQAATDFLTFLLSVE